ncbi:RICIN domain-containing protein [Phytomonospora endophytica]|uniref:Ricin B lectin domain-containing protein n=1 Tax=Phytomonospora endophytica TaxID=714109 RepID=A0A841FVT2_9ACTN|nr:RICIN domain-containing protein [Phytomonospora endophytica]MBB6036589.1 hypothetical protein [Phytomonospora endophytica]GIG65910.1 hypothetical protein Pen01_22050 [Phytomonospora endophytica]
MNGGPPVTEGVLERGVPKAHVRKRNGARRVTMVVAGVLTLVLAGAIVAYATDMFEAEGAGAQTPPDTTTQYSQPADDKAAEQPLYPVDGLYQIRVEHSSMCLGTGPERGEEQRTIMVQQPCEEAWPDLELTEIKDGTFTIVWKFADRGWETCVGVEAPGTQPGAVFVPTECKTSALLSFKLKALPDGFYQIGVPVGGLCLGVKERSAVRGAPFETTKCDKGQGSQRFEILPV